MSSVDFPFIAAGNQYGHGIVVAAKVLTQVHTDMTAFIQSGQFPYKSLSDLQRHALHKHNIWLDGLAPGVAPRNLVDAINTSLRIERENQEFESIIRSMDTVMNDHLDHHQLDDAKRVLEDVAVSVRQMRVGAMRDRYLEMLSKYAWIDPSLNGVRERV